MKIPLKITMACMTCFFAASPAVLKSQERVLRYSCGEATRTIDFTVLDAHSKNPVANAIVTFFDRDEVLLSRGIEYQKEADIPDLPARPAGLSATTNSSGKVSMQCKVSWNKTLFENGVENESIVPRGELRLECEGYRTRTMEMDSLFPKLTGTSVPPVSLYMKKGINRPPVPENTTVAKIDWLLPSDSSAAENALWNKFFNQPEEYIFDEVSSANWHAKWCLFSAALVAKARKKKLDGKSLEKCLRALNYGKTTQTMLVPSIQMPLMEIPRNEEHAKEIDLKQKEREAAYELALKEREKNPEEWYNKHLAIIPVGAHLARHAKGECWIIVCKWEIASESPANARKLGHIMIWAMDTKTADVVAYVTCD